MLERKIKCFVQNSGYPVLFVFLLSFAPSLFAQSNACSLGYVASGGVYEQSVVVSAPTRYRYEYSSIRFYLGAIMAEHRVISTLGANENVWTTSYLSLHDGSHYDSFSSAAAWSALWQIWYASQDKVKSRDYRVLTELYIALMQYDTWVPLGTPAC